jgi:hypothetical protein
LDPFALQGHAGPVGRHRDDVESKLLLARCAVNLGVPQALDIAEDAPLQALEVGPRKLIKGQELQRAAEDHCRKCGRTAFE